MDPSFQMPEMYALISFFSFLQLHFNKAHTIAVPVPVK